MDAAAAGDAGRARRAPIVLAIGARLPAGAGAPSARVCHATMAPRRVSSALASGGVKTVKRASSAKVRNLAMTAGTLATAKMAGVVVRSSGTARWVWAWPGMPGAGAVGVTSVPEVADEAATLPSFLASASAANAWSR